MNIEKHLVNNCIDYEIIENDLLFNVKDVGYFLIIKTKNDLIFDEDFNIILDDFEMELADSIQYFCFNFGGKWYYFHKDDNVHLKELKYLGKWKDF